MRFKIGLFDSGVGGFTILRFLIELLPALEIYYIADDAYAPYGTKSDEVVVDRSAKNSERLLELGAQMIVVACNTATAISINSLRERFPDIPFVGVEPYLNILNKEGALDKNASLVVLTTKVTGESQRFRDLKKRLDSENKIDHVMFPELASCIEHLFYNGDNGGIRQKINDQLDLIYANKNGKKYTHAILGCTHYPLIDNYIESYLHLKTISPGPNVANQIKNVLIKNGLYLPDKVANEKIEKTSEFNFFSTKVNQWQIWPIFELEKKLILI